ncbi:hypothetical protein E2C01_049048 [Portunus trituberculatus]|uniref:Uncharacterized protein n=1 Tax=Portunus trituberculatus TaxID=210409 RepID=A0A5B7GEZ9_PORTR|nr:hypothetical protein [Portunus trituberculatus]
MPSVQDLPSNAFTQRPSQHLPPVHAYTDFSHFGLPTITSSRISLVPPASSHQGQGQPKDTSTNEEVHEPACLQSRLPNPPGARNGETYVLPHRGSAQY